MKKGGNTVAPSHTRTTKIIYESFKTINTAIKKGRV